jgi:hypothetical protein
MEAEVSSDLPLFHLRIRRQELTKIVDCRLIEGSKQNAEKIDWSNQSMVLLC